MSNQTKQNHSRDLSDLVVTANCVAAASFGVTERTGSSDKTWDTSGTTKRTLTVLLWILTTIRIGLDCRLTYV